MIHLSRSVLQVGKRERRIKVISQQNLGLYCWLIFLVTVLVSAIFLFFINALLEGLIASWVCLFSVLFYFVLLQIVVWKRYSDFKKLHKELWQIHKHLFRHTELFPPFAKAIVFGKHPFFKSLNNLGIYFCSSWNRIIGLPSNGKPLLKKMFPRKLQGLVHIIAKDQESDWFGHKVIIHPTCITYLLYSSL